VAQGERRPRSQVDELAQTNLALFESNKLKGDFLATMSHELRTPLNSILGFSDVLLSGEALSDKQRRWVSNIQTSGQKLLALINDILDLPRSNRARCRFGPKTSTSTRFAKACSTSFGR